MTFKYLASPYSHEDENVRNKRFHDAMDASAWLLQRRIWIYSPIMHCAIMVQHHELPYEAEFWTEYDFEMIKASSGILVLTIDGWISSKGVTEEIKFGIKHDIPVQELNFNSNTYPAGYVFGKVINKGGVG